MDTLNSIVTRSPNFSVSSHPVIPDGIGVGVVAVLIPASDDSFRLICDMTQNLFPAGRPNSKLV